MVMLISVNTVDHFMFLINELVSLLVINNIMIVVHGYTLMYCSQIWKQSIVVCGMIPE